LLAKVLKTNNSNQIAEIFFKNIVSFLQEVITYSAILLIIIFFISTLLVALNFKNKLFSVVFKFVKVLNILIISVIFLAVFAKFNLFLWFYKEYSTAICLSSNLLLNLRYIPQIGSVNFNGSILSDVVVLLALSSGLVCLYLLGDKNLTKNISNLSFFAIFFVAILIMVYTVNLLVMFVSFELLFLPTLYFIYSHGYVERVDKTLFILLY
jgi:formate hydrogenlyase subunit 3/multisubunit Na+/H+ antiporter MnhD subunit